MPGQNDTSRATLRRMPRQIGTKTRYPGVYRLGEKSYRVRAKAAGPDGKPRQAERIVDGTLEAAVKARADLLAGLRNAARQNAATLPLRPTVTEFAAFWLESKAPGLDEGTLDRYGDQLDFHILPFMGATPVDQVRPVDCQAFVNTQTRKGATPGTVRSRFAVLSNMLKDAVGQLELPRDPTLRVILPELPDRPENNTLTPEQLGRWLAAFYEAAPSYYAYALTMAFTGMRPCHVKALRWEDVDFKARVIHVRQKVYLGKFGPVSKKKRAPKDFPMPDELVEVLQAHQAWLNGPVKDYHKGWLLKHPGVESGLCFPNNNGGAQSQGKIWRYWDKANKATGLQINQRGLRRTFNDLLTAAQVNEITAEALTAQTLPTRKLYNTVPLDAKREALGRVLQFVKAPKQEVRTEVRTSLASKRVSDGE